MTEAKARAIAQRIARDKQTIRFVVYEAGEYDVATDHDLDTFWLGARVIATYDGT